MNSDPGNGQDTEPFEDERPPYEAPHQYDLLLDLEGFEGPIDLLLTLAREQKVDLTRISILQLADQYLEFIAQARELRLEVAADYLVMAAWLAYLKSRLLLPDPGEGEEPSAAELASRLAFQLQRLEAMRESAMKLMNRPQLGRDFFARGEPERIPVVQTNVFDVSLYDLLTVYANVEGISVKKGDRVSRGQSIAKLRGGENAYVHFEVREGFESVDPETYLR